MAAKSRMLVSEHSMGAQIVTLVNSLSPQQNEDFYVGNARGHKLLCEIRGLMPWEGYLQHTEKHKAQARLLV